MPVPPPHGSGPLTLEVRYRFDPPAEDGVLGRWARWRLPLVPPVLRGGALLGPVRWQVGLPEDWVALYPGSGLAFEQRLGWQRGLLRARAAWTPAELEQWFAEGPGGNGAASAAAWGGAAATLVARQSGLGPFALVTVPHLVWLVGCSLLVLAGGLLLWRFPPGLFWAVALLAVAGAAALAVGWPQAAAQVFCGAQVGLVVLAAVLGLRWVLHRRYRHRVAHVPGFSQRAPGSSLMTGSGRRPPRDVSTVDAAPPDPWASTEPAPSGSRS